MKYAFLTNVFLASLFYCLGQAYSASDSIPKTTHAVYTSEDVSLRFHAQWNVDEGTRKKLGKTYGVQRVKFDQGGKPMPQGLSSAEIKRWERLYKLCMSDGCYYCDAAEGSCELGTCGPNNEHCRPYLAKDGQPTCGSACADYAFTSILTCNDRS